MYQNGVEKHGRALEGSLAASFAAFNFQRDMRLGFFARNLHSAYTDIHFPMFGSMAMLRIHDQALSHADVMCQYDHSVSLIQSGRLDTAAACSGSHLPVVSGCAHVQATNPSRAATVDDGSCVYARPDSAFVEAGMVLATVDWSPVRLKLAYSSRPVVLLALPSRHSSLTIIPRVRNLRNEAGQWTFDVSIETSSCYDSVQYDLESEQVSYAIVQAGLGSTWQAGVTGFRDGSWHRVNYIEPFVQTGVAPVVVSQLQNGDTEGRLQRMTVRQVLHAPGSRRLKSSAVRAESASHLGFFAQLKGDGVACDDNVYFQELFPTDEPIGVPELAECMSPGYVLFAFRRSVSLGSLTLLPGGSQQATQPPGERQFINWSGAHQNNENTPPTLTQQFYSRFVMRSDGQNRGAETARAWSGRWSARVLFERGCNAADPQRDDGCAPRVYVFSSEAIGSGVRVFLDNQIIINHWADGQSVERPGGLWASSPLQVSSGYHSVVLEWHIPCMGPTAPCVPAGPREHLASQPSSLGPVTGGPTTSLWWSLLNDSEDTGVNSYDARALTTSLGWFATQAGLTTDDSPALLSFEAGTGLIDFFADLRFSGRYSIKPAIFGSISSFDDPDAAHLRLVSADAAGATLFAEELVCSGVQAERREEQISWIAVQQSSATASVLAAPTLSTDTEALQSIHEAFALPAYLRWSHHNNSDPCIELWLGVACNSLDGRSRVVALDLGNMDLTGLVPPWEDIERLTALRELSLAGNHLSGQISERLCSMVSLRSIALQHNELDGLVPNCLTNLTEVRLLWLNNNMLKGPLLADSPLGEYILQISDHNLDGNHWASLLPVEKLALDSVTQSFTAGILSDWDFSWRYEATQTQQAWRDLTKADQYSTDGPLIAVRLPFELPLGGAEMRLVRVHRDRAALTFVDEADTEFEYQGCYRRWPDTGAAHYRGQCVDDPQGLLDAIGSSCPRALEHFGGETACEASVATVVPKLRCHKCTMLDLCPASCDVCRAQELQSLNISTAEFDLPDNQVDMSNPSLETCAAHCRGYLFMGISSGDICSCGNTYGIWGIWHPGFYTAAGDACSRVRATTTRLEMLCFFRGGVRQDESIDGDACDPGKLAVFGLEEAPGVVGVIPEVDCLDGRNQTGSCLRLPVSSVSISANGTSSVVVEWTFSGTHDGQMVAATTQVEVYMSGNIRMNARFDQSVVAPTHVHVRAPSGVTYGPPFEGGTSLLFEYHSSDPCMDAWTGVQCGTTLWPVGQEDCGTALSCGALSWSAAALGQPDVCGASKLLGIGGCQEPMTYDEAQATCNSLDARLCTADEVAHGEGNGVECDFDTPTSWIWADSSGSTCSDEEAVGSAGTAGQWFRFETRVSTTYQVVVRGTGSEQLDVAGMYHATGKIFGESSLIRATDEVTMRWTAPATGTDGPAFVHVKRTDGLTLAYSILAIEVTSYTWTAGVNSHQDYDSGARVSHTMADDSAVAVDLPWEFNAYGSAQTRVYILDNGALSFGSSPSATTVDKTSARRDGRDFEHAIMAPLWVDLRPDIPEFPASIWSLAGPDRFVVRWRAPVAHLHQICDDAVRDYWIPGLDQTRADLFTVVPSILTYPLGTLFASAIDTSYTRSVECSVVLKAPPGHSVSLNQVQLPQQWRSIGLCIFARWGQRRRLCHD